MQEIKNAHFRLYIYGHSIPLLPYQAQQGRDYPIRDNCSRAEDPSEGCLTAPSFTWTANITLSPDWVVPILLLDKEEVVINTTIRRNRLLKTVSSACLRVRMNNTHFVPDSPPVWPIYSEAMGCEARNKWEPLLYDTTNNNTLILNVGNERCLR